MRQCGECTLCCKLLPVAELKKTSNERCKHQRMTGCNIYSRRPMSCRIWSCAWVMNDLDTHNLRRPDRSHYVIDPWPDYIITRDTKDDVESEEKHLVLQIWCDPKYPDAHEDPELRRVLEKNGIIALIRYSYKDAAILFPPSRTDDGTWQLRTSNMSAPEHMPQELIDILQHKEREHVK